MNSQRCPWATNPLSIAYHDLEWGVPLRGDDARWFEFITLEGAQAGLSWDTILAKRDRYRAAFQGFDPATVALFTPADVHRLLQDPGLVRNRLKLHSTVTNAQAFLAIQATYGSFDAYIWRFVNGQPQQNYWQTLAEVPASTPVSDALSKDLKKRGFRFAGTTICYALMQATGMVNDHLVTCPRHGEISGLH